MERVGTGRSSSTRLTRGVDEPSVAFAEDGRSYSLSSTSRPPHRQATIWSVTVLDRDALPLPGGSLPAIDGHSDRTPASWGSLAVVARDRPVPRAPTIDGRRRGGDGQTGDIAMTRPALGSIDDSIQTWVRRKSRSRPSGRESRSCRYRCREGRNLLVKYLWRLERQLFRL